MGALQLNHFVTTNYIIGFLILLVNESNGLNLGLIAGDFKKPSSPLIIKKFSRHSPIFININNSKAKSLPSLSIPKLPPKPPPLKILQPFKLGSKLPTPKLGSKLPSLKWGSKLSSPKLPRSIIPPFIAPPIIPKLPLLPFLPPLLPPLLPSLLPPILPPLPILPIPLIPRLSLLPKLTSPFKPLRVPILKKSLLQKALGSEHKPVIVPFPEVGRKENMLEKLMELRKRGSLTTAEFIRFKKLLLK